jgi:septum formation inhibitor-activating ATPase MinD
VVLSMRFTIAKEALIVTTSELPAMRDADRVMVYLKQMVYQMKLLVNRVRSDMISQRWFVTFRRL